MNAPGMNVLGQDLARLIQQTGPIPIARYMAEALGHPRHGYYMRADPFGADGDFTTAPEISQIFGELVGLWLVDSWMQMGSPSPFNLIELGPGRGTLMADILRAAKLVPAFGNAVQVHLVEMSPTLRKVQAKKALGAIWHDRLDDVPDGPFLLVANEFFDALPIRQLVRTDNGWFERMVDYHTGVGFVPVTNQNGLELSALVPAGLRDAEANSVFEFSPASQAIVAQIGERTARNNGRALIIDYGYGQAGLGDTLQSVRAHNYAPVFEAPGEVDLTAHVNFPALSAIAREKGAAPSSIATQGAFLGALGIKMRSEQLTRGLNADAAEAIKSGVTRLIKPDAMGDLFKVLAVAPKDAGPLPGF